VWTDRGDDAVFSPGDEIRIKVRASEDAYLLVYEIDAEGYVHELFPYDRSQGGVEGHRTYDLSRDRPDAQLVAEGPVGEGYIVAVASLDPFEKLPWYAQYLRFGPPHEVLDPFDEYDEAGRNTS